MKKCTKQMFDRSSAPHYACNNQNLGQWLTMHIMGGAMLLTPISAVPTKLCACLAFFQKTSKNSWVHSKIHLKSYSQKKLTISFAQSQTQIATPFSQNSLNSESFRVLLHILPNKDPKIHSFFFPNAFTNCHSSTTNHKIHQPPKKNQFQ